MLSTPILDYVEMMEAKFISGDEPLDKFENYQNELKKLGVDEYIGIYQKYYDAYMKNKK